MKYVYDVYLSYAIKDNEIIPKHDGWVNNFQKFLDLLLTQILGEKPTFLNYSSQEKPASTELAKTAIMVCILSPEYIKNEACIEEVQDYHSQAVKNNELKINGMERIFNVIKYPVPHKELPSALSSIISYDLFYTDLLTGEISEFHDFFNPDAEKKFWLKLVDLAYDISKVIRSNENLEMNLEDLDIYSLKNVYLAETGPDLLLHRDNIKRELVRHGFRVLPDHLLPFNMKEMELNIKKDLEKSRLSIHLIGDTYGEQPKGSDRSILDIQNRLAGEYSMMVDRSDKKFSRLIWISPEAQLHNDKQKMFVDNLRRELEANEGAEILQSPIEDFKMVVLEELLDLNLDKLRQNKSNNFSASGKEIVYLIYDKIDDFEAKKIGEFLKYNHYEVVTPAFDGKLLDLREKHLNNLKECDIALIYINKVNDLWVQMKFLDLLKAPGLGRTKQDLKKALITGKMPENKIEQYQQFDVPLLENNANFEHTLLTFLKSK